MLDLVFACATLLLGCVFSAVFLLQRKLYRERRRRRTDAGFYPTTRDLGNALHTLQIFAAPRIEYVMQVKQAEPQEDAESGDDKDQHL